MRMKLKRYEKEVGTVRPVLSMCKTKFSLLAPDQKGKRTDGEMFQVSHVLGVVLDV